MSKENKLAKYWNKFWEIFEIVANKSYRYSFVFGLAIGFFNSVLGTIVFIILLTGFFNSRTRELERGNKKSGKIQSK